MGEIIVKNGVSVPLTLQSTLEWLPFSTAHEREVSFDYHSGRGVESYLIDGAILCKCRDSEDWKSTDYNNFFEWALNERRISRTQAQRMISIWDTFGHDIAEYLEIIIDIPFTNLYEAARIFHIVESDKRIDFLHLAKTNTERHFKDNCRELEGKVTTDTCGHDGEFTHFKQCKKCKKFIKVEKSGV